MVTLEVDTKARSRARRSRRRPLQEQRFSSYLTFGFQTTICLCIFLILYVMVLLWLSPLLSEDAPEEENLKRGEIIKPYVDPIIDRVKHMPNLPGQILAEDLVGMAKRKINDLRKQQGLTDSLLIDKAKKDLLNVRRGREEIIRKVTADKGLAPAGAAAPGKRSGFMVLGMHRSGTSMLAGLLVQGYGYKTGGPLIGAHFDNEKGFFERIDIVLQNDEFMNNQKVWWSNNVLKYQDSVALEDKKAGRILFKEGVRGLAFLNNPDNAPWLQKDPRMCITLGTWLPLMNNEPAILFTYRHPLEVAKSLKKREKNFPLEHGLRLWIAYNIRALQKSAKLCRVYSSNDAILKDTLGEIKRIKEALTNECGVLPPPKEITAEEVAKFVDPSLQHNKKNEDDKFKVIEERNGCKIREYATEEKEGTVAYAREKAVYVKAMRLYCDFASGAPYKEGYVWPEL